MSIVLVAAIAASVSERREQYSADGRMAGRARRTIRTPSSRGGSRRPRAAELFEPEAAALATATPDGRPSVRMVLVRGVDEGGLRFYTNHESRKAAELAAQPACGPRLPLGRRHFGGRPASRGRSRGSARTRRSRTSARGPGEPDRGVGLAAVEAAREPGRAGAAGRGRRGALRRRRGRALPPFWGGYRVVADGVELWQDRPSRLHDRARFERSTTGWRRSASRPEGRGQEGGASALFV